MTFDTPLKLEKKKGDERILYIELMNNNTTENPLYGARNKNNKGMKSI